jgi:hypothetical protein
MLLRGRLCLVKEQPTWVLMTVNNTGRGSSNPQFPKGFANCGFTSRLALKERSPCDLSEIAVFQLLLGLGLVNSLYKCTDTLRRPVSVEAL